MPVPTAARRRGGRWLAALLLGLALGPTGCAYYNTFYLAKKYYNEAITEEKKNTTGRTAPSSTASYEKAIKQCAKILQRYRTSKWVDDALLLTGKSFYGQGNYGESRRWLQQLVDQQPNSELVPEARVWIGRTHLAEEDFEMAGRTLRAVLAEVPRFEARPEALFFVAESEIRQEKWNEAIQGYRELVERFPRSERLPEALHRVGDAQFGLRQYADAERSYRQAAARARDPRARMQSLLRVGQMLEKQEQFDAANKLYDGLSAELVSSDKLNTILSGFDAAVPQQLAPVGTLAGQNNEQLDIEQNTIRDAQGNEVYRNPQWRGQDNPVTGDGTTDPNAPAVPAAPPDPRKTGEGNQAARSAASQAIASNPLAADLPQVLLRRGNALMEMGQYDRSIKTFESVLAAYPRTSEAGEAQYRIGYIQEVYLEDFAAARVAYDLVKLHGASLFVEQAARRSNGLERLVALAAQDSARATGADASLEAEAEKQFLAAELAWFQQEKPDKAIELYAEVETNYPKTSFAPRAALARAWLLANVMADTTAGRAAFESVEARYGDSEQGRIAHQILTGEVIRTDAPDSLAIAAFEDSLDRAEALADSQAAAAAGEQARDAAADSLRAAATGGGMPPDPNALGPAGQDSAAVDAGASAATIPSPWNRTLSPTSPPTPSGTVGDSLSAALAREAARRRSLEEARALAEAARGGDSSTVAQNVTPEELARLGLERTPAPADSSPPATTGGTAPAATGSPVSSPVVDTGIAADRPPSRLAPESATGLPRVFSARRPVRGPAVRPPRTRQPQAQPARPTPAPADTTRGSGRGRAPGEAWR
jgi:TolA-binding protein